MSCCAELSPIFTYEWSGLMDLQSSYSVVEYTELVAKTVAFAFSNVYGNYGIWRLSHRMIEFTQNLSLKPMLGSDQNVGGFEYILKSTFGTDFRRLPQHWSLCSKRCD